MIPATTMAESEKMETDELSSPSLATNVEHTESMQSEPQTKSVNAEPLNTTAHNCNVENVCANENDDELMLVNEAVIEENGPEEIGEERFSSDED